MNPRIQAAMNGEKKYIGPACKNCGSTSRYTTSGGCVDCMKIRSKDHNRKIQEMLKKSPCAAGIK